MLHGLQGLGVGGVDGTIGWAGLAWGVVSLLALAQGPNWAGVLSVGERGVYYRYRTLEVAGWGLH